MQSKTAVVKQFERLAAMHQTEEDLRELRDMPLERRLWMIEAVCAAAMECERAKPHNGIAPTEPQPWPQSTRELLRRYAANARR